MRRQETPLPHLSCLLLAFSFSPPRHDLMTWCWQQNPRLRPSFVQILESIQEDMSASFRAHAFFCSPENKHSSSGGALDLETDKLLEEEEEEEEPKPAAPALVPRGSSPQPLFGPGQPNDCCPPSRKPRL